MSKSTGFAQIAKELSRDPQLRQAIVKARNKTRGKGVRRVDNAAGVALLLLGIASRFTKKRKARALDEAMDVVYLLVQVSIVLKENVFDRPEVKKFFRQSFRQVYSLAQQFVAMVLPRTKGVARRRPAHYTPHKRNSNRNIAVFERRKS